ncbi:hypothetical protein HU200_022225 [Digitaria exilis]|uniref:Uncharacterized protein n=1 Tax=Digitaria exilis TaxID=1010633 RepID=A0A835EYM4_9POAL|nr:hypothetical protein HU200_022225 [Digitaria exilis]
MKRQQHRKNYPSGIRSAGGQTTLQSFLVKPRVVDAEAKPSPPRPPPEVGEEEAQICPPEPPKREIVRVTRATIKEKACAFSSVRSAGKDGGSVPGGALSAAVFKRFHSSAPVARAEGGRAEAVEDGDLDFGGGGGDVRLDIEEIGAASRRPEPRSGDEHGGDVKARRVVVLGDDPRPRPAWRRGAARPTRGGGGRGEGEGGRALYNHCKIELDPVGSAKPPPTRAEVGGGTATWRAWTARRSAGPTTCGRGWAPSRSAAWSGTSHRRRRGRLKQNVEGFDRKNSLIPG